MSENEREITIKHVSVFGTKEYSLKKNVCIKLKDKYIICKDDDNNITIYEIIG